MEKQAVFLREDVVKLLRNKFIVILGDSVQRSLYKDLVVLLQENRFLSENELRKKGELTVCNDELLEGGTKGELNNGTSYKEVRQFKTDYILIRFYFLTRVYGPYMDTVLTDLMEEPKPDVVILNSCLWDITRYGPASIPQYKKNLVKLFRRLPKVLPPHAMVVWNTTLPVSSNIKGGFLVPEVAFMNDTLRLDILEANYYTRDIVVDNGYDVLDLHYYFRWQLHRRAGDGVHWDERAHRRITNLVLAHIATAWGMGIPRLIGPDPVVRENMIKLIRSQSAVELDFHSRANLSVHGPRSINSTPPHFFDVPVVPPQQMGNSPQQARFSREVFTQPNNGFKPGRGNGRGKRKRKMSNKSPKQRYGGPGRRMNNGGSGGPHKMSPHMAVRSRPYPLRENYQNMPPHVDFSRAFENNNFQNMAPLPNVDFSHAFDNFNPQNMPSLPYVDFSRALGSSFTDYLNMPPLPHQDFQPPPQQDFNMPPPPQQDFNMPPQHPQQDFNMSPPPPQQNFNMHTPSPQQNFNMPPSPQQSFNMPPHQPQQNFNMSPLPPQQNFNMSPPPPQQNFNMSPHQPNHTIPTSPSRQYQGGKMRTRDRRQGLGQRRHNPYSALIDIRLHMAERKAKEREQELRTQ